MLKFFISVALKCFAEIPFLKKKTGIAHSWTCIYAHTYVTKCQIKEKSNNILQTNSFNMFADCIF